MVHQHMKNKIPFVFAISWIVLVLAACQSGTSEHSDISTDSVTIINGQIIFSQNCSSCHNFRMDGIGPQLGGLTKVVSSDWIKDFIKDPNALIKAGDERGQKLFGRYKTLMPAFLHLSDTALNEIVAYLHTQKLPDVTGIKSDIPELENPIPEPIQQSNVVAGLKLVTEIPHSSDKKPLTRTAKLDFIPKSDRLFMLDLRGKLYELKRNKPATFLDMKKSMQRFIDHPGLATGFGSFAFHPEFLSNGLLYTSHTESPGIIKADFHYADSIPLKLQWVISEWKTDKPASFPFSGKNRELLRIDMVTEMHGVQELSFNPNAESGDEDYGLLYIGIGDGGSVQSGYPFLSHSLDKAWGTIFRIDPSGSNSANSQYGIPSSNPYAKENNTRTLGEIYAYGFRNPHRISWSKSGQMLVANIGQAKVESVNLIMPGHDYGWPIREGTFLINPYLDINKVYPLPSDDAKYKVTYPAAQYDHDEGVAITGGFEYTGSSIPQLTGKYLFADMNNGRLFYIDLKAVKSGSQSTIMEWKISVNGKPASLAELCGSVRVDLRLGVDHHGEIYLFSKQDGKVYKLVPAGSI